MTRRPPRLTVLVLAIAAGGACRTTSPSNQPPVLVQPGPPGQASREIAPEKAADLSHVQATQADISFMQGMIGHHAQAVEMVELLKSRSKSDDMQKLGQRIELSQEDEIKMMEHWLEVRGAQVPGLHAMHMHGAMLMPGMLTQEEMDRLAAASGAAFDRLFLEGMIKHHGGAITMVNDLFAAPGAGQEAEIFGFASDVVADQQMEIDRMTAMLKELQK